jgi:ERCC4-type nuclease
MGGDGVVLQVVVDDREARCGVVEVLRGQPEVMVAVRRLAVGDYVVDGRLVVERKRLVDFAASVKDGRLFRQGLRLAKVGGWRALILEGVSGDLAGSGMRREALQGALVTVSLFLGVPVLRARDLEESVQLLLFAARQGRAVASGALSRRGRRPQGRRRAQLHVLQGLPGVGPRKAERLLAVFGSVEAVMAARPEELRQIEGIGASTADAIRWAVREDSPWYLTAGKLVTPFPGGGVREDRPLPACLTMNLLRPRHCPHLLAASSSAVGAGGTGDPRRGAAGPKGLGRR